MVADAGWGAIELPQRVRDALPVDTVELSGDVIAFDAATAERESAQRLDPVYWVDLDVDPRWVVIGTSGSGDEWLVGPDGGVSFFDHDQGERAPRRFVRLHISVTEWLMAGHAIARFERLDEPTELDRTRLQASLEAISVELSTRWPYDLGYGDVSDAW